MTNNYRCQLILGDWSNDGHNQSDKILIESNKTVLEIQEAYKASCKLTTVSFNHNEDYTGVKRDYNEAKNYRIATEYESSAIPSKAFNIFLQYPSFNELLNSWGVDPEEIEESKNGQPFWFDDQI